MGPCLRIFGALLLAAAALPLLGVARRSLAGAFRSLRLAWMAGRARTSGFARVGPGAVALRGRAVAIDAIISEETERRGVYLAFSADRWAVSRTIGGISGNWLRSAADEQAAPFELTDGTSSVLVDPRGAEVLGAPGLDLQLPQPDGGVVRYHEAMLEDGAEVVVIGVAEPHGGFEPSAGYRGHGYRMTVTDAGRGELAIAAPRRLRTSLTLQALGRVAGVLPALAVLALLLLLLLPLLRRAAGA